MTARESPNTLRPSVRSVWIGYAAAVVLQGLITLVVLEVQDLAPAVNLRVTFVLGIGLIAYLYGGGPGTVSLVSAVILYDYYVLHPRHTFWPIASSVVGWIYFASFIANALIALVLMVWVRRYVIRSRRTGRSLEEALAREKRFSVLVQRALLPEEPRVGSGYEVALGYSPVMEGREIGGDFYDVFASHNAVVVLIGDVSGKGLEAASLAATIRSTIHAFAYETHRPGESLTRTNAVISTGDDVFGQFATALLVVVDRQSGRLILSSAGHPPAVICRAGGEVRFIEAPGQAPLRVLENVHYHESYSHLEPGDKLVLYTNGISEARRNSEQFDMSGIRRTLAAALQLSPQETVDLLLQAASDWAEGRLRDDAAVIVLARTGR